MAFSKRFPQERKGSPFANWKEVILTKDEEKKIITKQKEKNIILMQECIEDAKKIFFEKELKNFQSDIISIAIALFEKRSSHLVYWKEEFAKEKLNHFKE